jgi:hypothetical protein
MKATTTRARLAVAALLILVLAVRAAAMMLFHNPVTGDSAAYYAMAESLSHGQPMRDMFGQAAFYSPGYPILLALPFALFGASAQAALALNLVLALVTALLVVLLARRITGSPVAALVAGIGYALWVPSVYSATFIFKENLTTPLLLGFVLTVLKAGDSARPMALCGLAGLLFGLGLLGGTSSLLTILAFLLILARLGRQIGFGELLGPVIGFGIGASAVLSPWFMHSEKLLGSPVLTTNSGFNLYLGNNPAATGRFVSIADTPMGPRWKAMRAELGEIGASDALGAAAKAYILAHPGRTAELAATKLGLFWAPNVPDAADDQHGIQLAVRWIDVAEHVVILMLGLCGAIGWFRRSPDIAPIVLAILGFWAIHGAAYMIIRYREPVMPLMIVLGALPIGAGLKRWGNRR